MGEHCKRLSRLSPLGSTLTAVFVIAVVGLCSNRGHASPDEHANFVEIGVGGADGFDEHWAWQVRLTQAWGHHLSGAFRGIAIGFSLEESVGTCSGFDGSVCFSLGGGPAIWAHQPIGDWVYLSPSVRLNFMCLKMSVSQGDAYRSSTVPAFVGDIGIAVLFRVRKRVLLSFQPLGLEFAVADIDGIKGVRYRWYVMGGMLISL